MMQKRVQQPREPGGRGRLLFSVLLGAMTVYAVLSLLVQQMVPLAAQTGAQQVSMLCDAVLVALMVWQFPRTRAVELRAVVLNVCWLFLTRVVMGSLIWQSTGSFYVGVLMLAALSVPMILGRQGRGLLFDIVTLLTCAVTLFWGLLALVTVFGGGAFEGVDLLTDRVAGRELSYLSLFGYGRSLSASFFLSGLGLMVTQLSRKKHLLWRILALLYLPVALSALMLTRSASAVLAASICLGTGLGVAVQSLLREKKPALRRGLSIVAAVALTGLFCFGLRAGAMELYRVDTAPADAQTAEAEVGADTPAQPADAETPAPGTDKPADAETPAPGTDKPADAETPAPEAEPPVDAAEDTGDTAGSAPTPAAAAEVPAAIGAAPAVTDAAPARPAVLTLNGFVDALRARPLTLLFGQDEGEAEIPAVNNLLLQQILTAGIPGMLICLVFVCAVVLRSVRTWLSEELSAPLKCLSGLTLALLVFGMLEPMLSAHLLFVSFLFCLLTGCLVQGCEEAAAPVAAPEPVQPRPAVVHPRPVEVAEEELMEEDAAYSFDPERMIREERPVVHVPQWMLEKTPVLSAEDLARIVNMPGLSDEPAEAPAAAPVEPVEPVEAPEAETQRRRGGHHRSKRPSASMRMRPGQSRGGGKKVTKR